MTVLRVRRAAFGSQASGAALVLFPDATDNHVSFRTVALTTLAAGRLLKSLITPQNSWCPRGDSNARTRLRRPLLYPLSYEGTASILPAIAARCPGPRLRS